jgi:hypothetical protein
MHRENVLGSRYARAGEEMKIRLMRGQVVVREVTRARSSLLWTPDPTARQQKTHTGVVLGLGPPARLTDHPNSPEVFHGFQVGDIVQYHFTSHQEAATREWTDGKPATWIPQMNVDCVWESERHEVEYSYNDT